MFADFRPWPQHSAAWCQQNLKVVNKQGQLVELAYNWPQQELDRIFFELLARQHPVRMIILKARQLGCSTWVESLIYDWICHVSHQEGLILADAPDSTNNLYGMFQTYYDNDPEKKATRFMHSKGLTFSPPHSSKLVCATAKKKYVGTSLTVQAAHLSEVAKWQDPQTTMLSLAQALPAEPNTLAVMESTAAGAGDYFNDVWDQAVNEENEWCPVFFPWFDMPSYQMETGRVDMRDLGTMERFNLYKGEETDAIKEYSLEPEQIAWRRWCINNNCGGDVLLFHQEYPASPEQAFISAGQPRFSVQALQAWLKESTEPLLEGTFPAEIDKTSAITLNDLVTDEGDFVAIWAPPQPGHRYVLGADCKGSSYFGDYNAAAVFDRDAFPHPQVCTVWGVDDADHYAAILAYTCRLYNNALMAVEVNGVGEAVQNRARHLYHNFYHRLPIDQQVRMPTTRIGWYTGHITRHNLIEGLAEAIRDRHISVPCRQTILEFLAFHRAPGNRNAEAKPGAHDDRVFASGIALQAMGYTTAGEYRHYDSEVHEAVAGPESEVA